MPVFDDLKAKLQELFMFDRADLDFGMYRVLNAKRVEVTRFLETELLPSVRAALGSVAAEEQARLKAAVDTAREQARRFGAPDPDAAPAVQEAKAAYSAASDTASLEEEIYSHLLAFFSRYYQEGDFIAQRRYSAAGRERYMIPYDGEEVKLVWANMEQYYVKSSESLTDYAFTFETGSGKKRVEFKLISATEETANNKPQNGERRFALADLTSHPPVVGTDGNALILSFTYVEHPKGTKQVDLLGQAETAILASSIAEPFKSALAGPDSTYTGKGTRTFLRKHLEIYAAKNTYDYFIHKDLGGFLRRELDYFIKSEVLQIDDLLPEDPVAARQQLKKVRALRGLASQIIAFLEQIENFQKRLWLKKKFVTGVRYCITLNRIPEEFYPEIAANKSQREEWKLLYSIHEIERDTAGQPGYPGDNNPLTIEFLKANSFLMVDTGHFSVEFAARLVAALPKLDEALGGVAFQAENTQALKLIAERYKGTVNSTYIDPPYNIGNGDFQYKDQFQHSSWISSILASLSLVAELMPKDGLLGISIDDNELISLGHILNDVFGRENRMAYAPWKAEPSGGKQKTGIRYGHEYLVIYSNGSIDGIYRDETELGQATLTDDQGPYIKGRELRKWGDSSLREDRPTQYFPLKAPDGTEVFPYRNDGNQGRWRWGKDNETVKDSFEKPSVFHWEMIPFDPGVTINGSNSRWDPYEKIRDTVKEAGWTTWLDEHGTNADGTKIIKGLFGSKVFGTPKPLTLLEWFKRLCREDSGYYLDFFAGSGTSGHAVINLNREDKGQRKYILVEMGEYFETVLVPRLKKVVYCTDWKLSLIHI